MNQRPIMIYLAGAMHGIPEGDAKKAYASWMLELTEYFRDRDIWVVNAAMWEWLISGTERPDLEPKEIYAMDIAWIQGSDMLVADIGHPSLGVGYEIGFAESLGKLVLAYHAESQTASSMIRGNPKTKVLEFASHLSRPEVAFRIANLIEAHAPTARKARP